MLSAILTSLQKSFQFHSYSNYMQLIWVAPQHEEDLLLSSYIGAYDYVPFSCPMQVSMRVSEDVHSLYAVSKVKHKLVQ